MADKAEQPSSKSKRKLRKPVETVREKAAKQEAVAAQPRRLHKTRHWFFAPFRAVGSFFHILNKIKPFRIIGFILVPPFLRRSWRELRQVTWPTFKVSRQLTLAVVIFAIVFGVLVAAFDFVLDKLFKEVLLK